jgi:hypothetical protein
MEVDNKTMLILKNIKTITKQVRKVSILADFIIISFKNIPVYRVDKIKQSIHDTLYDVMKTQYVFEKEAKNCWRFRRKHD